MQAYLFLFFCTLMNRPILLVIFVLLISAVYGQQERLPADLRQHNLTTYNASLFNPAFSVGRNNPDAIAFWSRWQWQGIDADPSTLFLNYTRSLNERSAAGLGFFQHNTGIFFNTGAALNYARTFVLNERIKLAVGANLFGFSQKLADDRFQVDPNLPILIANESSDFILQLAPGVSVEIERLTLSLASENLLDYNFRAKEGNTAKSDKIFMSLLSYDFPVALGSATNAFLRPSMYLRTIPGQSNQVGFYTHLNTDGYYGQVGYNNFYGYALGGGYTFFKRVTVGALMEIGSGASLRKETSFELMASYFLGTPEERHKMVGHDIDEDTKNPLETIEEKQREEEAKEEAVEEADGEVQEEDAQSEEAEVAKAEAAEKKAKEVAAAAEKAKREAEKQQKAADKEQRKLEKAVQDSIADLKKNAALAAKKQEKLLEKQSKETLEKKEAEEAERKRAVQEEREAEKAAKEPTAREEANKEREAEDAAKEKAAKEAEAAALKKEQQRRIDSVAQAKAAAIREARLQKEAGDNAQKAPVKNQPGERYEEVQMENGLLPGYYLIANVFSTQKYFEKFMADLKSKGLRPRSFKTTTNGYRYVFLERYSNIEEARAGRDSNFGGKYSGTTWVFRVLAE